MPRPWRSSAERARFPFFAPLLALLSAVHLLHGNLEDNEIDTLSLALHHVDPGFLAGDFRISLAPRARLAFQIVLAPLLRVLPLPAASLAGRLGLYALLAAAFGRLAAKLDLDLAETLIAGALHVLLGQELVAGEFMVGGVESKTLAYALVLFALDAAIDRRWARSGAALGLAFTFHPAVGLWSALAAGLALPFRDGERGPARTALRGALPAFLVAAAPGLALLLPSLGNVGPASAEGRWLYVYFRHPHHLDPRWFLAYPGSVLRLAAAFSLAVVSLRVRLPTAAQRAVARFARATLAIFALGLAISLLPGAERFLVTYPFRVGDTLFPLLASALVVQRAFRGSLSGVIGAVKAAGVAGTVVLALAVLVSDVEERREWEVHEVRRAYAWIRDHTEEDALVLCSPSLDYAGLYMRRPTVASARAVPTAPSDVAEWYRRLVDLAGGQPPRARGFHAFQELEAGFQGLSAPDLAALAARYGARYLLRRHGQPLPYEALYDDGTWAVYRIPTPGS